MSAPFHSKPAIGFGFIILSISLLFLVEGTARDEAFGPDLRAVVLTGAENHTISLGDAQELITNHRLMSEPGSVRSEMFGRGAVERILDQQECAGLRIYYGKRNDMTPVLVLMGVDKYGSDLRSGEIAEHGFLCPPICDTVGVYVP